jgi:hypothetical protein
MFFNGLDETIFGSTVAPFNIRSTSHAISERDAWRKASSAAITWIDQKIVGV